MRERRKSERNYQIIRYLKGYKMNNDFLPKDYKEPELVSNYTKLEEGETRLRMLEKPQLGWQGWKDEVNEKSEKIAKPVRIRSQSGESFQVGDFEEEVRDIKFIWVVPVYNYTEKIVQIWTVTQASIRKQVTTYLRNKKWGNPLEYDLAITREGREMMDTRYTVIPEPKELVDPKIQADYLALNIGWEAWWAGEDPFQQKKDEGKDIDLDKIPV